MKRRDVKMRKSIEPAVVFALAAWFVILAAPSARSASGRVPANQAPASFDLPPEKDSWIQVQTAHFVLYSDTTERRTVDLGRRLERFRAALSRFNKKFRVDPAVTTSIFVFKDDASFTPYKKRFNGKIVDMAGMFVGRQDGYYIELNGAKQGDPLDVIYHEYVHHYLGNNLHGIPAWFNEGMAQCYSGFRADDKTASIGLTQTDQVLFLREHDLLPLHDLFAITHDSADYNEGERRGIFYAESWALMHYLMWDKPERKPQFAQFLERLDAGEPPDTAFPAAFATSYEGFEKELSAYVRQARFMLSIYKLTDLGLDENVKVAPMTRAQALCRLGDLLAHADEARAADAEALFREAQRLAPDDAASYAGLGYLAQIAGRLDDAVALYDKALALDPKDPLTAFHLGQTLARRASGSPVPVGNRTVPGDLIRAEDMFGQTIQQRHDFGEAYVEYANIILEQGFAAKAAVPLLEAARVLLPSRIDVVVNLATLYAITGQAERAHEMVDKVLAKMNDPEVLALARKQIQDTVDRRAAMARPVSQGGSGGAGEKFFLPADRSPDVPPGPAPDDPPDRPDVTGPSTTGAPRTDPPGARGPGTPTQDYNSQVAVFNEAVALANKRDYKGAIARLEKLRTEVQDRDLLARIDDLLAHLKKDAARFQKGSG